MNAERPLAEGHVDDINDGVSDTGHVRIVRHNRGECFLHLFSKALVGAGFILGEASFIRWTAQSSRSGWCPW